MNSSDSAEEIVKLSLEGMEVAFKIAGAGAKNIAVAMYTIMKDNQQTKGKTRLTNMLKMGKSLKIFTIKADDLRKFSQEAKKYGVLYCALANKKNSKIDGMVDIMVREEDASKINRIAERFNFKDVVTIRQELERAKETKEKEIPSNIQKTVEKNQSENFLNTKLKDKVENFNMGKKSVKEKLKEIQEELKSKKRKTQESEKDYTARRKQKKTPKHYKEKSKGKGLKDSYNVDFKTRTKKVKNKERSK